jgi:predicted Zn-dependent peptidase
MTCCHGRVVDTRLRELAELFGDMLMNTAFRESEINSERNVILEEICMCEDTPEEVVCETLWQRVFSGSALARPILGSAATLRKMTGDALREYKSLRYTGAETVVALSGSFTDADLRFISDIFAQIPAGGRNAFRRAKYKPAVVLTEKPIEQNHISIAFPSIAQDDARRYAMAALSDVLGGGMSSRLFRRVREERGLCYSVYSYAAAHADTGLFSITTALGRESEREALCLIREELERFARDGVTEDELARAKEQAQAAVLLSLESTSARMNRLGRGELQFGYIKSPEEVLAGYNAVTRGDVLALARETLDFSGLSLSVVGAPMERGAYLDILRV